MHAESDSVEGIITTEDRVDIFYRVTGGGADTLVVLHGGPGMNDYLSADLAPLSETHTLISYDQRGGGHSTPLSESDRLEVDDHVRDLEHVRRYFGIDRMVLLGHSWGAGLAAHYTHRHPDRVSRLILVGSMPLRRAYMAEFGSNLTGWMDEATRSTADSLRARYPDAEDIEATCRAYWGLFIRGYFPDPDDPIGLKRMQGDVCDAAPRAIRNTFVVNQATLGSAGDWDWRDRFGGLRLPVLIIHGAQDPIPLAAAEEWLEAFENSKLVVIDSAGHFPYVDRPDEFFGVLLDFIQAR
ncbi:MAG: alpha/beta hydrolase [Rhodothermales bacterium]